MIDFILNAKEEYESYVVAGCSKWREQNPMAPKLPAQFRQSLWNFTQRKLENRVDKTVQRFFGVPLDCYRELIHCMDNCRRLPRQFYLSVIWDVTEPNEWSGLPPLNVVLKDLFDNPTPMDKQRRVPQILKSLWESKRQYEAAIIFKTPERDQYHLDSLWNFIDFYVQQDAYEYRAFVDCVDVRRFISQSEWDQCNDNTDALRDLIRSKNKANHIEECDIIKQCASRMVATVSDGVGNPYVVVDV